MAIKAVGREEPSEESARTLVSINPATEEELGRVVAMDRAAMDRKMAEARRAFGPWSQVPLRERQRLLERLNDIIVERVEEIATLLAREQGKPMLEAKLAEILPVLAINQSLARRAHRLLQPERSTPELVLFAHKRSQYRFVPYGVILILSPWNYPFSVPIPQMAAAVVAGNTVVFKPSPEAILVGQKIDELFRLAGFPEGVVNTVFVTNEDAAYLVEHPEVRKILLTGSTETGRKVMAAAAHQLKPVLLELGGKDAAVIAADADVERAAKGIVWGAFFTSGQVCASVERVYVERPVAEAFLEACLGEVKKLRVGDPLNENTDLGPLMTNRQLQRVISHIEDAISKGATIVTGGHRIGTRGFFFEPTVLTHVNHSMKVMTEETFGPILPIMVVDSLDEAIRLANDSPYGLTAFGWTRSRATAERLQQELEAGTVMINDATCTWGEPSAPWGGVKQSGLGRTRSRFGLLEMVQIKYTSDDEGDNPYNPWWFPYDRRAHDFGDDAIAFLFARKWRGKGRALVRLLKNERFVKTAHWKHIVRHLGRLR